MLPDLRLGGVAIYNPHLLARAELVSGFVCHGALLERIATDLRAYAGSPAPHRLILGPSGMGKTTLLHRLRCRVDAEPALSGWLPLVFPEEQYSVDRLSVFWLRCLAVLGVSPDPPDDAAGASEPERARRALATLTHEARVRGKQLLLLVDNVDMVLDRLGEQEWAMREALSQDGHLTLIGTSSKAPESSYRYDRAFYDFFVVDELRGLDRDEARALLVGLAEQQGTPEVAAAAQRPERIEPVRVLTGGNPRMLVMLYTVLAANAVGDARTDLEQVLDRCTPMYKARFEALSPQAQKVLHELAMSWHPIGSGDLAKQAGLRASVVSGQLDRLVKAGLAEKVPLGTDRGRSKRLGYQVTERPFNIWYLMRLGRHDRYRVIWLVELLRLLSAAPAGRAAPSLQDTALPLAADVWTGDAMPSVTQGVEEHYNQTWDDILQPFAERVASGRASDAVSWLDEHGMTARWLPLRTALQVIVAGDDDVLLSVAPEVRGAARVVLEQLRAHGQR